MVNKILGLFRPHTADSIANQIIKGLDEGGIVLSQNVFHLSMQVRDIEEARNFYGGILGCIEGRSTEKWVDFNLYGHQISCHLNPNIGKDGKISSYVHPVDGDQVPIPHFGVVLKLDDWEKLVTRFRAKGIEFLIEPHIRFEGTVGEQATMFFLDPSGNAIEFKAFKNMSKLFEKNSEV